MDASPIVRRLTSAGFTVDQIRAVVAASHVKSAAETRLASPNGSPRLVQSGWIAAQHRLGRGLSQTLRIYMPGDLLDEASAMLPSTSLVAMTSALVVSVPAEVSRSLQFAALEREDIRIKARQALEHSLRLGRFDAQQKMAHFLLEFDTRWRSAYAQRDGDVPFPFRQPDIADYLALSPVHVNRTLMALRRAGLIDVSRSRLSILDPAGLKRATEQRAVLTASIDGSSTIVAH